MPQTARPPLNAAEESPVTATWQGSSLRRLSKGEPDLGKGRLSFPRQANTE